MADVINKMQQEKRKERWDENKFILKASTFYTFFQTT